LPTPSSPSPGNHVRIEDEVAVPKVGVLGFGAAEASSEDLHIPIVEAYSQ